MLFNSPIFLFLFLPVVILGYFLLPNRFRNSFLLISSLLFYAWGELQYSFLLISIITVNYLFGLMIQKRKRWIYPAVVFDLLILGYFKYAGFILANLYKPLTLLKLYPPAGLDIHLPLGISFITFHVISYILDVRNDKVKAERSLLRFALYISLFPHLIAGPIVKYREIKDYIASRTVGWELFNRGVARFIGGLAKKVILADNLARVSDHIFGLNPYYLSTDIVWLALIFYSLQIFFDFSGYTDMAIGLANIFGFEFPENFNYPYLANSVQDFWRRWHMTLTNWFREYIYIPLGGNRKGFLKTSLNLLMVFFLTGFWHGASWHFIFWGVYFGLFLVLERSFIGQYLNSLWTPLRHFYTLLIVVLGWLLFRIENLSYSLYLFRVLIGRAGNLSHFYTPLHYLTPFIVLVFISAVVFATPLPSRASLRFLKPGFLALVFIFSLAEIAGNTFSPFIYFRF